MGPSYSPPAPGSLSEKGAWRQKCAKGLQGAAPGTGCDLGHHLASLSTGEPSKLTARALTSVGLSLSRSQFLRTTDHPQMPDVPRPRGDPGWEGRRSDLTQLAGVWLSFLVCPWSRRVPPALRAAPYLLCDRAGTLDQLPFGVAVRGAHLEGPRLLHQEDAAVAQVLHPSANLEADLWRQARGGEGEA